MGLKAELLDKAEDIGREIAIQGIAAFARWVAKKVLGDQADDGATARIMRAAIDAAAIEASNRIAAGVLPERMRDLAAELERDFAHVFEAQGTIPKLGLEVETVTQAEYDRRKEAGEL